MKTHTHTHTHNMQRREKEREREREREEKEESSLFPIEKSSSINWLLLMMMMMMTEQQVYMYKMVICIDDVMDVLAQRQVMLPVREYSLKLVMGWAVVDGENKGDEVGDKGK